MGHFLDELHVIGNPPLGDLAFEIGFELIGRWILTRRFDHNQQGPLLIVVKAPGEDPSPDELKAYLEGKIAKWWIPDDVQFIEEMPHTATGKIQKTALRDLFAAYEFPA